MAGDRLCETQRIGHAEGRWTESVAVEDGVHLLPEPEGLLRQNDRAAVEIPEGKNVTLSERIMRSHDRHDCVSEELTGCDIVSDWRVDDEANLDGALRQGLNRRISAADRHIEQHIRVSPMESMQHGSDEALNRRLKAQDVDSSRLQVLQRRYIRRHALKFVQHLLN